MSTDVPPKASTPARDVLVRKDVLAGLLFMAVAFIGLWVSRNYPVGTALRMGTAYVPRLLLWSLLALGAIILLMGVYRRADAPIAGAGRGMAALWPIACVTAALVAFGLSVERFGLVVAIALLIGIASFAERELGLIETALTAIALATLCVGIFSFGLGLTIPIWPSL